MLAVLSAVFGFAAPFLPVVFKTIQGWMDNRHELEMFRLRLQAGAQEHLWRMEEINARADIEEARVLHQPQPSFGVQVLDAATKSNWGPWAIVPAFYLFTLLDFLSGLVRPAITYAAFMGYLAYKWALFAEYTGPRFESSAENAILMLWGEQDWAVLTLVLSYWFGLRQYKAVFGGNAGHGGAGK